MSNPFTSPPFPPPGDAYDPERLTNIILALEAPQHWFAWLSDHYDGVHPLSFLAPEAREALGRRFDRLAVNIPRLVITSIAERLRLTGFDGADAEAVWQAYTANDLDLYSYQAHAEALLFGRSYAFVWTAPDGSPRVSIESARQCAVLADPGSRQIVSAVKRWRTATSTEAVLLLPDRIERYSASAGATSGGFNLVDVQPNNLGVVPVVQLLNHDRLPISWGVSGMEEIAYPDRLLIGSAAESEIWDVCPLSDALGKLIVDMLVSSEYVGRPRRYATGIELMEETKLDRQGNPVLDEDGNPVIITANPIKESSRMAVSENSEAKFGQLDGARLDGYEAAVNVLTQQIAAVSSLPAHYLGVMSNQPPSADALRASEQSLVARCEQKQRSFGKAWQKVGQLMMAVQNGVDPRDIEITPVWAPADEASQAQEADSTVKLVQAGILPVSYGLRKLGYTDAEIEQIRKDMAADGTAKNAGDPLARIYGKSLGLDN
jgi:hypothetical protein